MKRIRGIVIIVLLALFFGYGLMLLTRQACQANSDREWLEALDPESVESIQMQWNIYEYTFTKAEVSEFAEMIQLIPWKELTVKKDAIQGDGCGTTSKIEIQACDGKSLLMDVSTPYGGRVVEINGKLYESKEDCLQPLAEFLDPMEEREFVNVNNQMAVSAHFPLKKLKETKIKSMILLWGDRSYQFTPQEIETFCDEYAEQAVYEKMDTYQFVDDIYDVHETELVIEQVGGDRTSICLNYKVILIDGESYLLKQWGDQSIYSFIKQKMGQVL